MTLRHSLLGLALALGMLTLALPETANAQSGGSYFRVSIVGIRCVTPTSDSALSTDGAGDEIVALANVVELSPTNTIVDRQVHESLIYGDITGRAGPGRFGVLDHPLHREQAGHAGRTGGMAANDVIPDPRATPRSVTLTRALRARLIPMIVWQGQLRRGATANGVLILPTVWEMDNVGDLRTVWDAQASTFMQRLAAHSAAFVAGTEHRTLVTQSEIVLRWTPNQIYFDRPVGMFGGYYNPGAASPQPGTFIPAVMALTLDTAIEAAASTTRSASGRHGVVDITYKDADDYGPGNYVISVLVERLSS